MYKTCTHLYTALQLAANDTHLWCTHYAWISCTTVRLYCSQVSVRLYCQFVLTNYSPSNITFMNHDNQSELRFLGIPIPTIPPAYSQHVDHVLSKGKGRGKNNT